MNRILTPLALAIAAALPATAQDDPVKKLQERVQETAKRVSSAFVFFPGGSGILISDDGWCLTNHHVIGMPTMMGPEKPLNPNVKVLLQDGKERNAELKCTDAVGDIALLKLEPEKEKFNFVTFADSDKVEVGQYVLAIGAPFGIGAQNQPAPDRRHYPSVSLGIVSAMHRYQAQYGDCIQTDAAVNPGNSGGPLVDLDGRLVGINGRILTRYMNRVNSGVGFAIPSNQILNFLPKMKEGGINRRIYHGTITGLAVSDQRDEASGVVVSDVGRGTAAADRGFKEGDVIVAVNGHKVFNRRRFQGIVSTWPAESEVSVTVRRDDRTVEIKVALEGVEERAITGELLKPPPTRGATGATFEDDAPGKDGPVTVTFVAPLSPAETAGLSQGDIVLKVDGVEVKNRKTILAHLREKKPGDVVTFRVLREGDEHELKIKLGRMPEAGE